MKKITLLLYLLWFISIANVTVAQINSSIELLIPVSHKYVIERLAWSDNGRHFATGSNDGYIKIWDAKSASIIYTLGKSRLDGVGVAALCFTPDGKYLLSGLLTMEVWDVASGQQVKNLDAFTGAYIYSIDVSADSKTVLAASGSTPSLWDIKSGRQRRGYKHPGLVHCVKFTKDATKFLTGCADGIVRLYDTSSKAAIKEFKLTNKKIIAVAFSFDESKIIFADGETIYLCDRHTGNLIKSFEAHPRRDRAIAFTADDSALLVSEYQSVRKIEIKTGKSTVVCTYDNFNEVDYSKDRKRALYSIQGTEAGYGTTDIRIIDLESGRIVREFRNRFSSIKEVKISPDNHTIAATLGLHKIRLIDLSDISSFKVICSNYVRGLRFSQDGKVLAYGHQISNKDFLSVVDPVSLKNLWTLEMEKGVSSISFSGDNKLIAVGLTSGQVKIIDLSTGSAVYSFRAVTDYVTRLIFSIKNDLLLVATSSTIEVRDVARREREWYYPHDKPLDEQKFPNVNLQKWIPEARMLLNLYKDNPYPRFISGEQISIDGKNVVSFRDQAYFVKRNVELRTSKKYEGHQGIIQSLSLSDNNKLIVSSANDNSLRIWDNTTGKTLVSYFAIDSSDWFWITPDNFYYSSKNASKVISFKKNNQIYRFHQFDLQLNRPDLVMKSIGLSSDSLVSFYTQLIEKRFRRMEVKSFTALDTLSVPVIDIVNLDSIPDNTTKPVISLNVKATSQNKYLKKINVWVNGVPIYNSSLKKNNTVFGTTFQTKYSIPLIEGKNVIEVSCTNQSESESLIESVLVNYDPPEKQKPSLYIVSIGVSEYKRYPSARLMYADKDATDLVKKFSASALFDKVYMDTLTNTLATRENILRIKKMFMNARTNDMVILSFSGHGTVDSNHNFYFCTNEIDTARIANTAVNFEEMENLLDSIPAYKKILLIDACYSGEVDQEEAKAIVLKSDSTKALHIGGAKPLIPSNTLKLGKQRALELMKESFIDLRRRTGTAVIASSSGVDVSYEKDKWMNGLFTYAVLSALSNPKAVDLNGNGIYVSELIPYVVALVKDLSLGLQVPTIREENFEFDFRIW